MEEEKNIKPEKEKNNNEIDEKNNPSNRLFFMALITAILIFIIFVFVSQFITFKNKKDINLTIKLEEEKNNNPSN